MYGDMFGRLFQAIQLIVFVMAVTIIALAVLSIGLGVRYYRVTHPLPVRTVCVVDSDGGLHDCHEQ